jgi:excisionase family DNA binding protein
MSQPISTYIDVICFAADGWQAVRVTEQASNTPGEPTETPLEELVGDWLTVPDAAERLGVPLSAVRRMIEDRELLAARLGERRVVHIPARFLDEKALPHLKGTFTVLGDGGMHDDDILRWLFTPDSTLPVAGAPIDALASGFKTEVRRRAMEQAF